MEIKVTIIEDHKEFRESVYYILHSTEGFNCIGKFSSVEEALDNMKNSDVILLDINLPGMSGIEGIPKLKELYPNSKIVVLTVFDDNKNLFHAILSGADGYILKKTAPIRLIQAVEDAAAGGSPMTPSIAKQAMELFKDFAPRKSEDHSLTERETEILSLIIEGFDNEEISKRLFISLQTVRNHIRHIYEKLHVHSKTQAVVKAIKEGIL